MVDYGSRSCQNFSCLKRSGACGMMGRCYATVNRACDCSRRVRDCGRSARDCVRRVCECVRRVCESVRRVCECVNRVFVHLFLVAGP